ncbi:EAL domain-containing protein [Alteromonas sp. ASW11-36]|uniref:EAL domain-containing protein n=1 Tax=Alteromonas arenosi TaxID=3055817 RepID=A0ABT7SYL6_9ALTE|nr:EAL domain-containing protein [Alteromonas sp. ASW11-36]MDM7861282.1 EAL domain-containing protein [Alteromonas sp. ASW11-36]
MPIKEITESFSLEKIVPFFQPIMDLEAESVWRYECLARLINEQEVTFLPNDFLFIVERNNWCQQLTETMLLQSAQYFRHLNIPWNINIDTQDLLNPKLIPFVRDVLAEYPHRERISIELTAHAALHYENELAHFVQQCSELGIGIFIDNVGATPVNVQRLLSLPLTGVKLSGNLINHYVEDPQLQQFVDHVCEVAHAKDVAIVAEHVENQSTIELLKQLSIRYAQGFLFYPPGKEAMSH